MPPRTKQVTVDAVVPLYHRVYTALRQHLLEGRHVAGQALPGEPQLARHYGVARVTIRRALHHLEAEGLVVRHASRGTYPVEAPALAAPRANISLLLENLITVDRGTAARPLSFEVIAPPPDIAARLDSDAPVLRIERLRLSGQTPVAHDTHYLPPMTASAIDRATLGAHPVPRLLQDAGFIAASAEQALTARTAEAAIAAAFEVPLGSALICLKRLVRDEQNRPIEYHESLYRPDRYEYRLTLVRGGSPAAPAWVPVAGSPA